MKNCVFLNTAWITLTILSEKRGNAELPKTLTKTGNQIFISGWFKENLWSVNQKFPHSDSTAVIILPLRADWPGDAAAFWSYGDGLNLLPAFCAFSLNKTFLESHQSVTFPLYENHFC